NFNPIHAIALKGQQDLGTDEWAPNRLTPACAAKANFIRQVSTSELNSALSLAWNSFELCALNLDRGQDVRERTNGSPTRGALALAEDRAGVCGSLLRHLRTLDVEGSSARG